MIDHQSVDVTSSGKQTIDHRNIIPVFALISLFLTNWVISSFSHLLTFLFVRFAMWRLFVTQIQQANLTVSWNRNMFSL